MRKSGIFQPLKASHCSDRNENMLLFYTEKGELRRDEICLEYNSSKNYVTTYYCHEKEGLQVNIVEIGRVKNDVKFPCYTEKS